MTNVAYGVGGYGQSGYGNEPIEMLPIGYYLNLVTSEYINSEKFNKLLYVLLKKFDDVTNCMVSLDTALDLDVAVGAQLDMLGTIVNLPRTVDFQPTVGSPTLDDETYRIAIKARIAANHWDGTLNSLFGVWKSLFPDGTIVVEDNQNMSANVVLTGTFSSIIKDLITHDYIVPRPQGVLYNYLFGELPFFGFGSSPGFIAGFGEGHWA